MVLYNEVIKLNKYLCSYVKHALYNLHNFTQIC